MALTQKLEAATLRILFYFSELWGGDQIPIQSKTKMTIPGTGWSWEVKTRMSLGKRVF